MQTCQLKIRSKLGFGLEVADQINNTHLTPTNFSELVKTLECSMNLINLQQQHVPEPLQIFGSCREGFIRTLILMEAEQSKLKLGFKLNKTTWT